MYSIILADTVVNSTAGDAIEMTTMTMTVVMTLAHKIKPFYSHSTGISTQPFILLGSINE